MKKLILKSLLFLSVLLTSMSVQAQQTLDTLKDNSGKSTADLLWDTNPLNNRKSVFPYGLSQLPTKEQKEASILNNVSMDRFNEIYLRNVWDWGIYFWKRYPNDSRRLEWFKRVCDLQPPLFFKDIDKGAESKARYTFDAAIDMEAYRQWGKEYEMMREEYFRSGISEQDKILFQFNEFNKDMLFRFVFPDYRNGRKLDLEYVKNKVAELAPHFVGSKFDELRKWNNGRNPLINNSIPYIALYPQWYGLDKKSDLVPFYQSLMNIPDKEIASYGETKAALYSLFGQPFNIKHVDVNGKLVDTKKMKEKVIFLDFWSTGCKSCIAMMPHLKELREKYKSKGFEIISICVNKERDKDQVLKIYEKVAADWRLLLIGGKENSSKSLFREIWDKYKFTGVPQLFLLDENRNVISYQPIGNDLDKILEERLGK